MLRSLHIQSGILLALLLVFSSCNTPKVLFTVGEGKEISPSTEQISINRGEEKLAAEKDLKLQEGDLIQINEGVDGLGIRSFQTVSTIHGAANLVLGKEYMEQKSGTAIHDAKKGNLLIPKMSIIHEGASYLVDIKEKTVELTVFDGKILVSSTQSPPPWKPFYVERRQKRKIWLERGVLSPNQPLTPDALNTWIDSENQLLKAGNSSKRMVPSVVSLPSIDAQGLVESAEFPVDQQYTEKGEGDLGTISLQKPSAGRRIAANKKVTIYERSRLVIVPSVFGLSLGAAQDSLQKVGLRGIEKGKTITGSVQPPFVNSQKPSAKEQVAEGSTVELTIEAISVKVPTIVGKSIEEAKQILGGLKLEVDSSKYVSGFVEPPLVISQKPDANVAVLPGSTIKVVRQAPGFPVPQVVGMTEANANKTITESGFPVGKAVYKKSDKAKGNVISQTPGGGSVRGKEVEVVLTISKGN